MGSLIYFFCLCFLSAVQSFYLMNDYYMDSGHSKTFGGVCGQSVLDDSFYLNSHVNNLKLTKYPWNNECWMTANAGSVPGARYTIYFEYMSLQQLDSDGKCTHDYLDLSSGSLNSSSFQNIRYCGDIWANETWIATHPQIDIRFRTDDVIQMKGFKLKFVRSEPPPCQLNEWFCRHENRCIDGRLKCDGTPHCLLQDDEGDCNGFQVAVSYFLSNGIIGIIGWLCLFIVSVTVFILGILYCCRHFKKKWTKKL